MKEADKELVLQACATNDWDGFVDLPRLIKIVRADEREACAKLCERDDSMRWSGAAAAIRARGNT